MKTGMTTGKAGTIKTDQSIISAGMLRFRRIVASAGAQEERFLKIFVQYLHFQEIYCIINKYREPLKTCFQRLPTEKWKERDGCLYLKKSMPS